MMRKLCYVMLWAVILRVNLSAETIQFQVTNLAPNVFRYDYFLSGIAFQANEELDIRFDKALYGTLSNGVANSDFNVLLLQPNNPLGTFGDYSAIAQLDNPSLAGPFSVDFTFLGPGQPGAQPFFLHHLDSNEKVIDTIASGSTELVQSAVPEPSSVSFGLLALIMIGRLPWVRRRSGLNFL
jgi:hypothetical protein